MGVVTPIGNGKDNFWEGLLTGRCGIALIERFDCSQIATRIASEVHEFSPESYVDKRELRRMDRYAQFAVVAAKMALEDSGFAITDENAPRVGAYIGSGIGGLTTREGEARNAVVRGLGKISPFFVPMMIANMGTGNVPGSLEPADRRRLPSPRAPRPPIRLETPFGSSVKARPML